MMRTEQMELAKISLNPDNPRKITREKLDKLIGSILSFPKMLEARPIVVNDDLMALGGNMRHKALSAIAKMSEKKLLATLSEVRGYSEKTEEERAALADYWKEWKRYPTAPIIRASEFTEEEQREFVIKDNVSHGDWDLELLQGWDALDLEEWGMDFTDCDWGVTPPDTETKRLSTLEFSGMYYEPKEQPKLSLSDCVDFEKYNAKVEVIESSSLSREMKDVMRLFAYRFLKINFEAVANYYAFNATEEEKRVIERLRMVLVDGSIDGFFEDDLIRIREDVMASDTSWQTDHVTGYDYERE